MQPDDIPEMNSSTPWENAVKKWRKKMQSGEEYKETPEAREAHGSLPKRNQNRAECLQELRSHPRGPHID
jgi:hypothetical protein